MPEPPEPSTATARGLVTALVRRGVTDVVLAPGSRSAPLAYALHAAERAGWLRLHVRIDERVAGFVALGLARAGTVGPGPGGQARDDAEPRPVVVVTTSGTAVANLHPAVLEAAHAHLPLVVISADRPHEMRGTGANQTTEQPGIFAGATRYTAEIPAGAPGGPVLDQVVTRALAAATGRRTADPGPVHLNVGLRDPLAPAAPWQPGPPPPVVQVVPAAPPPPPALLPRGPRTLVVAGDGAGRAARDLAEAAGWPLLAEPSSGARGGRCALGPYRLLLEEPALAGVERVVVLGHPTLSRPVSALLARPDVTVVVVAPHGIWTDVAGTATQVLPAAAVAPGPADEAWLALWLRADRAARAAVEEVLAEPGRPVDGLSVARAVTAGDGAAGPGRADLLVAGSSSTVRDLDLAGAPGEGPVVVANRGLAGIDGTVSTATGLALGAGRPVRAVMGDLTFLHDAGGLLRGRLEREVDLQVVVVNDAGGSIFATLEHGAPGRADDFERVFATPQAVRLADLAAGYGAGYRLVTTAAELGKALAAPVHGRSVVEVAVDRSQVRADRERLAAQVRAAVRTAVG
ncbi:2-succinyl-5-enolpyruvyl-6-hydroxy-3-cyclohexene-1-carboxylic-acid synthase [Georgenia sp. TF02-10]|uniref:2-succinyl-5-enolpyruvyl-6-hydroxy-3- cyclohexene-1-carboxylic-acid synthase n=1 Tax=Georgenia sp. TF02-10 TaxID=2917725 RepID=UPI001FA6AF84|nr:2-succinyl-5-enolpyruvyl-6-hydroxy-3-cyclohexene-1-carboxylic-acid synthase [Georgenia sp. TF02-10]UNX54425.1 2-succinyl-5-enolpyruvyl-6-hydroxy-3-cyclohexene-1-carboxylic-acid synthase [Georgenia sp. TF02-10]